MSDIQIGMILQKLNGQCEAGRHLLQSLTVDVAGWLAGAQEELEAINQYGDEIKTHQNAITLASRLASQIHDVHTIRSAVNVIADDAYAYLLSLEPEHNFGADEQMRRLRKLRLTVARHQYNLKRQRIKADGEKQSLGHHHPPSDHQG